MYFDLIEEYLGLCWDFNKFVLIKNMSLYRKEKKEKKNVF